MHCLTLYRDIMRICKYILWRDPNMPFAEQAYKKVVYWAVFTLRGKSTGKEQTIHLTKNMLPAHCLGEGTRSPHNDGTQTCILWKGFPQSCGNANKRRQICHSEHLGAVSAPHKCNRSTKPTGCSVEVSGVIQIYNLLKSLARDVVSVVVRM